MSRGLLEFRESLRTTVVEVSHFRSQRNRLRMTGPKFRSTYPFPRGTIFAFLSFGTFSLTSLNLLAIIFGNVRHGGTALLFLSLWSRRLLYNITRYWSMISKASFDFSKSSDCAKSKFDVTNVILTTSYGY